MHPAPQNVDCTIQIHILYHKGSGTLKQVAKGGGCGPIPEHLQGEAWHQYEKKGLKEDPENSRPVCLTSVLGRIMEWFILDAFAQQVQDNSGIRHNQHGFMKGRF